MMQAAQQSRGPEYTIHLPKPHPKQEAFVHSPAKRIMVRAGRRGGKTVGVAIRAVHRFLQHRRVLYAAPTTEQIGRFWTTVTRALREPIDAGFLYKNETEHIIEVPGTENRIRAKTAWNADSLRGDYGDDLILDEFQLMNEDTWAVVGAPMLLDNNGDAVFIYTPPSLHTRSVTKAKDPRHAAKMFSKFADLETQDKARYQTFHFSSMNNPYISASALADITQDMTRLAYRMEILAEDIDEVPGALWKREAIEGARLLSAPPMERIVVAIDPSATSEGDEAGIVAAGKCGRESYVLEDATLQGSPLAWAKAAVTLFHKLKADKIVAEANNGGEMVALTIYQVDRSVPVTLVHASRGKLTRAEPVAAQYEQGRVHHVGTFPHLEDEMVQWVPGDLSPNRMDALVWAISELQPLNSGLGMLEYIREEAGRRREAEGGNGRGHVPPHDGNGNGNGNGNGRKGVPFNGV